MYCPPPMYPPWPLDMPPFLLFLFLFFPLASWGYQTASWGLVGHIQGETYKSTSAQNLQGRRERGKRWAWALSRQSTDVGRARVSWIDEFQNAASSKAAYKSGLYPASLSDG